MSASLQTRASLGTACASAATAPALDDYRACMRSFVDAKLLPVANDLDARQEFPLELVREMGSAGLLGALVATKWGGSAKDFASFSILSEEVGRGCASARSLVTVHSMLCHTVQRWGTAVQRDQLLSALARGELIGAFALTEPDVGSDAAGVKLEIESVNGSYRACGVKKWITFGQIADVFLVFGTCGGAPMVFLAHRKSPGIHITPISDMLGARASLLAQVTFEDYRFSADQVVGSGFATAAITQTALTTGRLSVASGCVGMAQACLEESSAYAARREQFGQVIGNYQLIRRMLADMVTQTWAARLLCERAAQCLDAMSPNAMQAAMLAKYFCGRAAASIARDAVELQGARGCSMQSVASRIYRDAKVMEIIEGTNELLANALGEAVQRQAVELT